LFTRFKHTTNVLFLDAKSSDFAYEKGKKVDIILSPRMYWVKKMTLPVSSVREVKKLLPSLFEDSLPAAHYSYTAYKSGEEFLLFAYEDKKVFELLADKDISSADIASIRFAQSEFDSLENALSINAQESMYKDDGLLVLVPTTWVKESQVMALENLKLSKHTIKLQQFGHIVDKKSLYKIGAILVVLALILLVEIFVASSKLSGIEQAKEALFSKYKLQATMMQNRSTYTKYSKIYERETKLRAAIALFLSMPLQANQKITHLQYKSKKLFVVISGVTQASIQPLLSKLQANKLKYTTAHQGTGMKVEVSL